MKFCLKTYGCQMNVRDSESVTNLLERHGHTRVHNEAQAEILLVNTCSVRGKAEDKALGKLGLLVAEKRTRPDLIVGVMGCMVQRLGEGVLKRVPGLDFAVGTHRMSALPEIVRRVQLGDVPILDCAEEGEQFDALTGHTSGNISAYVNILLGCDRRCAYCIVPTVRGREWSRPSASVLDEVHELAATGVREVTLLGQSVMSYGRSNPVFSDSASPTGLNEPLPRLLEAVCSVPGIERVRFTSGHPSGCTEELCRTMAGLPEVCEHLHLPMQSGSDRILQKMRRGYSSGEYREAARRLRGAVPGIAVTTDIIVGFPTETALEFEETRACCEEIGFDNAFIFKYSPRPGTPAADWEDDVASEEKMRRNQVLLEDQNRRSLAINKSQEDTVREVLAEGPSARNVERWTGRTRTNKIVLFDPVPGMRVGDLVNVRIIEAKMQTLHGEIVPGTNTPREAK